MWDRKAQEGPCGEDGDWQDGQGWARTVGESSHNKA